VPVFEEVGGSHLRKTSVDIDEPRPAGVVRRFTNTVFRPIFYGAQEVLVIEAIRIVCAGRSVYIRWLAGADDNTVGFDLGNLLAYRQRQVGSKLPCSNAGFFNREAGIADHAFELGAFHKVIPKEFFEPPRQRVGAIVTGKYFRGGSTA